MKKTLFILLALLTVVTGLHARGEQEAGSDQPLVWVWYPNESTPEFAEARDAIIQVVSQALGGREIREQLTTDYAIAIEALVNENATFSWFGGEGYVQAHARENAVLPLVVNSGSSGTLSDAKYYSMLGVPVENVDQFRTNGEFDLDLVRQRRMSFVSNSSTSGFRVPSSVLRNHFEVEADALLEGGPDFIFSEVMFGGSHQGSMYNLLVDRADVAAFCNECVNQYVEWVNGSYDDPLPGDIIRIKADAEAPFNTVPGRELMFIATVPVLNAPMVVNTNMLTAEELAAVRAVLTSDEVAANPLIFPSRDSGITGLFRAGQRFLVVEDSWYDPIRRLAGE